MGHNVEESFYAQHQLEALNVEDEILEELKGAGTGKTELELRQLLGCFLFSGDDVFKKIKVLSGGEKARVALAKTIAMKGNFLMLDEPTNHLDLQSVDMLTEALNKYEGTYILVSHDRYFISRTANKIWSIEDGQIKEFIGTYDEWVRFEQEKEKRQAVKEQPKQEQPKKEKPKTNIDNNELRQLQKEHQKKQKQFQKTEEQLNRLNEKKQVLEVELASPECYADKDKFQKTDEAYKQIVSEIEQLTEQYNTLFEEVLHLEEQLG